VYVGNLDFRTDKDYLEEKFAKYGKLKDVYLPTDGPSGRPRGCVFCRCLQQRSLVGALRSLSRISQTSHATVSVHLAASRLSPMKKRRMQKTPLLGWTARNWTGAL
jgi:RNA recognition motif-containing protein